MSADRESNQITKTEHRNLTTKKSHQEIDANSKHGKDI